ncbi:DUF2490 domain-containing protein [Maribacter algicola]|uniref:DUF2490 domain-containing protein n=1 Tax=Maribacter algicola TaxID=2498892 RepID=A0A426RMZ7_9FLAO|nr:DUF2490 domain-containing protein [Maribacter algicola]RRQ50339.1 DUF2490 domain-containing protein [Maribacter algicola]
MSCIKRISVLLFLIVFMAPSVNLAQDNLTGYWNPQVALNYDVTPNYSHNFSIENRSFLYRDSDVQLTVRQIDINHFSNLKTRDNQSVGFGIKYRIRNSFDNNANNELRLTQQFNVTFKNGSIRYGNRFRAEQRITNENTVHRFRYRFAIDFPLKGEELDVGEPYLVLSTEALLSVGKSMNPEYDQRITPKLGWILSPTTKFQIGGEYRAENYLHTTENVLFFLTELVLSL